VSTSPPSIAAAEFEQRGIEVIAVSGETRERTTQLAREWSLEHLPLAYGLTEAGMRAWGLFISHVINDREPALFSEPGLFLITPDHTVYYESILSMPVGRLRVDDLLGGIDHWVEEKPQSARSGIGSIRSLLRSAQECAWSTTAAMRRPGSLPCIACRG
jgi:AhpC/TSA family